MGRPIILKLSAGQVSDHKGAGMVLDELPTASHHLIADRGYDSAWFRQALTGKGHHPVHSFEPKPQVPLPPRQGCLPEHKVENLFAKLKDWRRIATRYGRCARTFFSATCIAATVIFWINES